MKFKCLVSGTIVEFTQPVDIESTLAHPQYELVVDEPPKPEVKPKIVEKIKTTSY